MFISFWWMQNVNVSFVHLGVACFSDIPQASLTKWIELIFTSSKSVLLKYAFTNCFSRAADHTTPLICVLFLHFIIKGKIWLLLIVYKHKRLPSLLFIISLSLWQDECIFTCPFTFNVEEQVHMEKPFIIII